MDEIQQEQGLVQTTERRIEDTLKDKEKKEYNSFMQPICCGAGMIGQIIYLLIISGIDFIFIILAISTSIKRYRAYNTVFTFFCQSYSFLNYYSGDEESSSSNGNLGAINL